MAAPFEFAVLSDIHNDGPGLERAVKDLRGSDPGLAALVLNGDLLDIGYKENYARLRANLDAVASSLPPRLIVNMGNHEFYPEYGTGPAGKLEHSRLIARYLAFAGRAKVYADEWIGGFHFISLGSQSTYNTFQDPSDRANLFPDQLEWLRAKLAEGRDPSRPVFVFLHQPLDDTLPWTKYYGGDTAQTPELMAIFKSFPEVLLFSSHSHQTWYVPGWNVWKSPDGWTAVDTSSVARPTRIDEARKIEVDWKGGSSEGVVVRVYADRVELLARDFAKAAWIPGGTAIVKRK